MSEEINIIPLYEEETKTAKPEIRVENALPKNEVQKSDANADEKENISVRKTKKSKKFAQPLINVISGNIFTKEEVVKHLPYVLFLALLALLYIANGYHAEDTVRQLNKVGNELKELRSEYITAKSELMHISKQSEVASMVEKKVPGLKESLVPPKKIVVKK